MPGEQWLRPPEEWQSLVAQLLAIRYPAGGFVAIPDRVRGDCGLEGFTRDGRGFQCYAAEEPLTVTDLTRKQKAKITTDIGKLTKYQAAIAGLLGPTVLTHWVLVVPRWEDKSVLAHAEAKVQELRTAGLSFVSPSIVPGICTADDFLVERQQLVRAGRQSLRIDAAQVDPAQMADWCTTNDALVTTLDRKAMAIRHSDAPTSRRLRDETICHYLNGQNALSRLRSGYPDIYEAVDRIKKDKEHFLATESLVTPLLPAEHWERTRNALETDIGEALAGMDRFTVRQLVHEAIADWLLRCPLDFPERAPQ